MSQRLPALGLARYPAVVARPWTLPARSSLAASRQNRWLADTTLFGRPAQVREGIEAWFDAGIKTPIIVPSSTNGGQFRAFEEFFGIWA